jgi:N-acetylmuramoyl-L-alanine amidase
VKKFFRWLTKQKKLMFIYTSFITGLIVLPFVTHLYWHQTQNAWMKIPVSGKVIILDPGHGGVDSGASSQEGLLEDEIALKIALYLRDYLQEAGAFVMMTRETDTDLAPSGTQGLAKRKREDLAKRIQWIQQKNGDVFISIHLNSIPSTRWRGAQTFYNPLREENKKLSSFIQSEMIRNLENTKRFPKPKSDVYILKHSLTIPTSLVEVGFLSNSDEAKMLGSVEYQKKIAAAIYYGIMSYYSDQVPSAL